MVNFNIFKKQEGTVHGVTEKKEGSINPFSSSGYLDVLKGIGVSPENVVFGEQIHGKEIFRAPEGLGGLIKLGVDALISENLGQVLVVRTADCVPLLIYNPEERKVAAIHAGRKGVLKGIIENTFSEIGSGNSLVSIGPHIRKCSYFLRDENLRPFSSREEMGKSSEFREYLEDPWQKYLEEKKSKVYFDLTGVVKDKLISVGVKEENIEDMGICTSCEWQRFYSSRHYEDYGERSPCFGSFIGIVPDTSL